MSETVEDLPSMETARNPQTQSRGAAMFFCSVSFGSVVCERAELACVHTWIPPTARAVPDLPGKREEAKELLFPQKEYFSTAQLFNPTISYLRDFLDNVLWENNKILISAEPDKAL